MFRMEGDLLGRIAYYLMNLHLEPRSIFLSRVGLGVFVDYRIV